MKLRFYAREDSLARTPGSSPGVGQAAEYIGREYDPETRGYPAVEEAVEIDVDKTDPAVVEAYKNLARRGDIFAADEATAKAAGAPFAQPAFHDGAWAVPARSRSISP